jgi:ATP-dependent DNA helicase RecG
VKIINAIEKNIHITTPMLAELLGLTIKGIEYHLTKLKKQGIIERIGPNKGGYWKINKQII